MIAAGQAFPVNDLKSKHCAGSAADKKFCESELEKIPQTHSGIEKIEDGKITPFFDAIGSSCFTGSDRNQIAESSAKCFGESLRDLKELKQGTARKFTKNKKPVAERPLDYTAATDALGISVSTDSTTGDDILTAAAKKGKGKKELGEREQSAEVSLKQNFGGDTPFDVSLSGKQQFFRTDSGDWTLGAEAGFGYATGFPRNLPREAASITAKEWGSHMGMFGNEFTAALNASYRIDEPEDLYNRSTYDRHALTANLQCGNLDYGRHDSSPGFGCGLGGKWDLFYTRENEVRDAQSAAVVRHQAAIKQIKETEKKEIEKAEEENDEVAIEAAEKKAEEEEENLEKAADDSNLLVVDRATLLSVGLTVFGMPWAVNTPFSAEKNSAFELEDDKETPTDFAFFEGGWALGLQANADVRWAGKYGSLGLGGVFVYATPGSDYEDGKKKKSNLKLTGKVPFGLSEVLEGFEGEFNVSHQTRTATDEGETEETSLSFGLKLEQKFLDWLSLKADGSVVFGGAGAAYKKPQIDPYLGTKILGGVPVFDEAGTDYKFFKVGPYFKVMDSVTLGGGYQLVHWSKAENSDISDTVHMGFVNLELKVK